MRNVRKGRRLALLLSLMLAANASLTIPPMVAVAAELPKATEIPVEGSLEIKAKSAVLMDAGTGTILYEQNAREELPPASVTKVMTMLLALEAVERGQFSLEDTVTISERAASMGGSQMYMEAGETHTVEELFQGASICSANDACVALAELTKGTEELFVEAMNRRAGELGMEHSHFVNTNGLPAADHYSCAYDIAVMSRELLKHPKPREWFSTWQTTITVGLPGKEKEFGLTNTNKMIRTYEGANGIKTGYTQDAGYCLSASATRGDLTLIAVVMGAESSKIRFSEASRLLDYGFATYDSVKVAEKSQVMGSLAVGKGSPQVIDAVTGEEISVLTEKGKAESISSRPVLMEDLEAPVRSGDAVGELKLYRDEAEIGSYPLYAASASERAGIREMFLRLIRTLY
ncbi:MAG: D-alanyl-D-alanine carboxypeptidase [Firmicutes bacterium]|nr:D-alanyl-D-alanine carboxypeptidase [Bacillota bacterium]